MVMMKVTINEIAGVIAVRNGFVSAVLTVNVSGFMTFAGVVAAAELMLVYMIAVLMMEVTIVEIVSVISVLNSSMPAGCRMLMLVIAMCLAVAHFLLRLRILRY